MAIAAVLALGSTPSFAQDAAPSLDLQGQTAPAAAPVAAPPVVVTPPVVAPAAPAPVLTLPVTPPETSADTPAERPAARSTRETPRSATRPARTAETAAPVAAAAPAAAAAGPAAPVVIPSPAPLPETPIAAAPVAPEAAPAATTEPSSLGLAAAIAAALAALGLGGAAFAASRSRRRKAAMMEDAAPEVTPIVAAPPAEPTRFPAGLREAAAIDAPAFAFAPARQAIAQPAQPEPARGQSTERFAIPAGPVPTGEAREALLEKMTAAAPDEANPFTSAKARRKRARLILQAREAEGPATTAQPFDWRTYKPAERKVDEPVA